MEGDFFGFSTLPGAVHNGNMKMMESRGQRSSDRVVGEDIDSRNDETFGEAALADDWEEEHEKMAVLLELEDPHLLPSDLGSAPGRKYKTRQEEALEESISHLIVEDDDDDEDDKEEDDVTTLHSITAGRPIPGRKHIVDLDELLGPTSPPGLLNTEELIGGHHSIWGSPHTRELKQKQQEDSLQNLLRAMQVQHIQDTAPPPILPTSAPITSLSSVLPNAFTLEEIEKDIIGGSTSSSVTLDPVQSRILAQDELLRNLAISGQASSPVHTAGLPMPIGTPPRGQVRRQVAPPSMASYLAMHTSSGAVNADQMAGVMSTSGPHQQLLEQLYSGAAAAAKLQQAGMRLSPTIHPLLNPGNPTLHSDNPTLLDGMHGLPSMETGALQRPISPATQSLLRSLFDVTVPSKTEATRSEQPKVQPPDVTLVPSPRVSPVNSTPSVPPTKLGAASNMSSTPPSGGSPPMGKPMRMPGPGHNRKLPLQGPPPWRPPPEGMMPHPFRGMHMGRGGPPRHLLPYPNMHQRPCGPPPFPDPGHMRFPQGGRFMPPPPRGYFPPQYGPRPPMFMGPRGGPPMPPHMHRPQSMRGGLHMLMPPRYPPPHFNNHPQAWMDQGEWEGEGEGEGEGEPETEEEEYAGLMLQREKDWVIKIQLLQLQTDNPYLDDFYYTTWLMKKAAEERRQNQVAPVQSKSSEPKLVLPHLARIETKVYKPVQFENSLGRLTSSNVHSPRQIIDVHADNMHEKEPVKSHELRRLKQILLDIEKNYDLLLEVDDIEKRVLALPDHARQKLFDERRTKINELFARLHCSANKDSQFVHMICIKKGLQLVGRLLPLLDQTEAQSVVAAVLRHLTVISRKDWQAKVLVALFESMQRTVSLADLETLVKFSDELRASSTATTSERQTDAQQTVVTALQNKFGSSVIWSLMNRGEEIYTQVSPVDLDTDHQMAWCKFVQGVVEAIDGVSAAVLAQPEGQFTLAQRHVARLTTNQQTLANIEDKLTTVLSQPQQPAQAS